MPNRLLLTILLGFTLTTSRALAQDEMDDVEDVAAELAEDHAEDASDARSDRDEVDEALEGGETGNDALDEDDAGDDDTDADAGDFGERNTGDAYPVVGLLLGAAGTDARGPADVERNFTFGIFGRYMLPVHKHVAIGGQAALRSWSSDVGQARDADRNMLVELAFVPAFTYPATREIELHAVLPIALAINFAGDFASGSNTGTGYGIGFLVGARFFLDPAFGLLAELGYMGHSLSHDIEGNELELDIGEASVNVGVFF